MVEMVPAIAGDVKICIAVLIVIGDRDPHVIAVALQSCVFGHVFKRAIGFLVIKPVPELRIAFVRHCVFRHRVPQQGAIGEKDIHPPIVIVIKNRNSTTHCLQQILQ